MNCIYLKKITIESIVNGKERKKVNRTRDERDDDDDEIRRTTITSQTALTAHQQLCMNASSLVQHATYS